MSTPTHSLLATVPAALHDKANKLAHALGYQPEDGDTFSIRLDTPDGEKAAFIQFVMPSFIALLAAGKTGTYPLLDWPSFGLSEEDVAGVMTAIDADTRSVDARLSLEEHMAAFLAERPRWAVQVAGRE